MRKCTKRNIGTFVGTKTCFQLPVLADWSEKDRTLEELLAADKDKEIVSVGILMGDIIDGELAFNAVLVALTKEDVSFDLLESQNVQKVGFETEEMMPSGYFCIWHR